MNEPKGKLRDQRSGGKAPLALFVASLALAAFAGGVWAGHYKAFPFHAIRSAYRNPEPPCLQSILPRPASRAHVDVATHGVPS